MSRGVTEGGEAYFDPWFETAQSVTEGRHGRGSTLRVWRHGAVPLTGEKGCSSLFSVWNSRLEYCSPCFDLAISGSFAQRYELLFHSAFTNPLNYTKLTTIQTRGTYFYLKEFSTISPHLNELFGSEMRAGEREKHSGRSYRRQWRNTKHIIRDLSGSHKVKISVFLFIKSGD